MFVNFNILNQLGSPAINSNTFANRPAAGQTGRLFVSTDTYEIYRDNGTTWDLIGGPGSSTITGTGTATQVAYFTSSQAIGSSANLFWDNTNIRLGIGTATPGAALDIHSTGVIAQFNTTSATGNTYIAFQRTGSGLWRIGDTYNAGNNFFELHNTVLGVDAMEFEAATNKSNFQAQQTYTTGLARGNYFDYNLSVAAGGSFSSPNAITALGASLDLTLAGNATIPSGARSGLDAYNSIAFTGAGTLTHSQGTQIRAYSNVTAGWAFSGSAVGTITHLAGLRALFPDNSGSAVNVTNNYALLLNDQTANTGTVTYTNRWGVYQEGTSDLNYLAANLLIGTTTNSGQKLIVNGSSLLNTIIVNTQNAAATAVANPYIFGSDGGAGGIRPGVSGNLFLQSRSSLNTDIGFITGTSSTERMTITGTGNIGINTISPTPYTSGALVLNQLSSNANSEIKLTNSTTGNAAGAGLLISQYGVNSNLLNASSGYLLFGTSDTERMRITSAGKVFIQTSNASSTNAYGQGDLSIENNLYASLQVMSHNNTSGNFTFLGLGKSRGTGAAPTVVADGEILSEIQNYGYDGSAYRIATQIRTAVQGTPAAGYVPGYLSFHTNNGSLLERARIVNNGNFLIGTTTDAGYKLQVIGTVYSTSGSLYSGGEFTLGGTGSGAQGALYSLGTGTPEMFFDHRGTGNTGTWYWRNGTAAASNRMILGSTGNLSVVGTLSTGAPTGGTAASWKLGTRVAATVVLDTTQYIELDVNGTLYKLAIVT